MENIRQLLNHDLLALFGHQNKVCTIFTNEDFHASNTVYIVIWYSERATEQSMYQLQSRVFHVCALLRVEKAK